MLPVFIAGENLISFSIPLSPSFIPGSISVQTYGYTVSNGDVSSACSTFSVFDSTCQVSDGNNGFVVKVKFLLISNFFLKILFI